MYKILRDNLLEQRFRQNGYVVLPFLSEADIDQLRSLYFGFYPQTPTDFFSTVHDIDSETRLSIHQTLKALLAPKVAQLLPGYEVRNTNYVVKRATPTSGLLLHQDVTMVDFDLHIPVHLWLPLSDVDSNSGCLKIVPGSHTFFSQPVDTFVGPAPYDSLREVMEAEFTVNVPMKAGEAFVYDGRLMHASGPNYSDHTRVAINCTNLPRDVQPRIYKWVPGLSEFWILEVTEQALNTWDWTPWSQPPHQLPRDVKVAGRVKGDTRQLTLDEIEPLRPCQRPRGDEWSIARVDTPNWTPEC
jgi:hypothetical protein